MKTANPQQTTSVGSLRRLIRRPWSPSNMVIKRSGLRMCSNRDCMAPATVAFEDVDAVWLACDSCTPDHVQNLTKLRLPNVDVEARRG